MSVRQPIGVVGAITPWNFPIAIPSWKLDRRRSSAATPSSSSRRRTRRCSRSASSSCSPRRASRAASSTSSTAAASTVGERARAPSRRPRDHVHRLARDRRRGARRRRPSTLKHVHLELGGKNAIIVLDDADLDLAVDGILWSAFGTSGQRCTAASRVIVAARASTTSSQKRLVERAEKLRLGPGLGGRHRHRPRDQPAPRSRRSTRTPRSARTRARSSLTGGEVATDGDLGKGFFYRPTIFGDVDPQMRIAQEEIFGPTTALIPVRDFDEAIRVSNGIKYGLSSSIFTRDVNKAFRAMRDLEAGHHVRQRRHDRRRGAPPVRRHEGHRQRPPRGGPGRARRVHRVEVDLRRLLRASSSAPRSTPSRSRGAAREPQARSCSCRARRSTPCARRSSRPAPGGSATTSAAPGTRRAPARSSAARGRRRASARRGARSASPSCGSRPSSRPSAQDEVVAALRDAHPYEEPAFDIYELARREGAALHRRRRARQPRPGRVRLRARGRGRDGARGARRGDRRRDEQRRRVPRPRRRARAGGSSCRWTRSRSSPTPSCS